ncbi:MAG: hypothetical protein ACXWUG_21535 [Polyangiales bacterium]
MSGGLQPIDSGNEPRCAICGGLAAGPCASCKRMVCGDCSVLTEGGVDTWAICVRCDRKKGRSLSSGWTAIVAWLVLLIGVLGLLAVTVVLLSRP